ncbi:MAG TPA: hypothetical protein VFA04_15905 [Bryobacteraceae bacterium]|nr:hypothetical protein [Bryobacteraceae bacterium]
MYFRGISAAAVAVAALAFGQDSGGAPAPTYVVNPGTKIPLSMINSISTRHAEEGDRVYLETVFPVVDKGKVVIPAGSYVAGTVTRVKRPGKVKGRGEFYLRFDSLTLPNGTTRDFRARLNSVDGRANEDVDKREGTVKSEGDKGGDTRTVAEATAAGASVGGLAGWGAGRPGMGVGIGAAAGATAGLLGVLLTRGPDAVLARGSTVELVLDRPLTFQASELDFSSAPAGRTVSQGPGPEPPRRERGLPGPRWAY